jgi:glycerol-3-phosphate cytidylyltransferase
MRIGVTFSTFDLLHAGHVKMLEEAKRQCDYLIVGLQLDPSIDRHTKNSPSQSIIERYIQLKACKYIDEIVPYVSEEDLEDILRSFKIDVRIIGDEYQDKNFTGKDYCLEKEIEIYYNSRDHRFSSTGLRKQVELANKKNEREKRED